MAWPPTDSGTMRPAGSLRSWPGRAVSCVCSLPPSCHTPPAPGHLAGCTCSHGSSPAYIQCPSCICEVTPKPVHAARTCSPLDFSPHSSSLPVCKEQLVPGSWPAGLSSPPGPSGPWAARACIAAQEDLVPLCGNGHACTRLAHLQLAARGSGPATLFTCLGFPGLSFWVPTPHGCRSLLGLGSWPQQAPGKSSYRGLGAPGLQVSGHPFHSKSAGTRSSSSRCSTSRRGSWRTSRTRRGRWAP